MALINVRDSTHDSAQSLAYLRVAIVAALAREMSLHAICETYTLWCSLVPRLLSRQVRKMRSGNETTFGEDLASYYALSRLA